MKKLCATIICIFIAITMMMPSVFAAGDEGVLTLPGDDGTEYPVTGISDSSYSNDENVIKLIVPENIVRLGERAFYGCINLKQIKLHNKIQRIGKDAFKETAFYNDDNNWLDNVLYIDDVLIKADPGISEVYKVREGTRLIADGAFEDCKNLKSIVLPDTVEYVGKDAFSGTALMDNTENWSDNALIINHVLISVDKEYASTFSVPEGIKTIADGAFEHSKITTVTTPDTLKFIGCNAFFDCQELSTAYLGKSVKTLGRDAFQMCNKLNAINLNEENEHFKVIDGVLYDHSLTSVVRCPQTKSGKITLPHTIKRINAYAFENCTEIKSVEIPNGCVFIGKSSFSKCEKLDISLPETIEYIDANAFRFCNSLESVRIPDNVNFLGEYAFSCCRNLKEATIGDGVKELKAHLFESCENLDVVSLGANIEKIDNTTFVSTKYLDNASNYQNGMLIASDRYLIKTARDLKNCCIPNGIAIIADGAFEYPAGNGVLSEIHLPATIEKINWGAFQEIPKAVPVHYAGSIHNFIEVTDFDWDCINLYTSDFTSAVWSVSIIFGVFGDSVVALVVVENIKRKQATANEKEDEDENESTK